MTEEYTMRVFECRVLRNILEPKREEVTGKWLRLYSEEHHHMYFPTNLNQVTLSRRM
jgi:hypothetical protein